jgi:hypothetical protein
MVYTVVIYFDNFGRSLKPKHKMAGKCTWLVAALIFVHLKTKWRTNALDAAQIFVFISKQNGGQMRWMPRYFLCSSQNKMVGKCWMPR